MMIPFPIARIGIWLGYWRNDIPAEAVKELQDIMLDYERRTTDPDSAKEDA